MPDYRDRRDPRDNRREPDPPPARVNPLAAGALGLPEGLVADVKAVTESLDHLAQLGVNLLAPLTRIEFIPPGYRLAFRAVLFPVGRVRSPEDGWVNVGGKWTNGTWYESDGGGLALHKAPLRQLAAAAGLSWETFDVSTDLNRWTLKAVGRIRNMDGAWRQVSAIKDLDLRDDGPIVPAWHVQAKRKDSRGNADARILKAREHGGRMAESKAVNALIRDALGLRTCYPEALARAPFVFPLLIWLPETTEARAMQAAVELGVVSQVYGPSSAGKVYAEAGTVIDAEAVPEARQLPGHGPDTTPNFKAEAERLAQRERVAARPAEAAPYGRQAQASREPSREDLEAYAQAKGWPRPSNAQGLADLAAYVKGKGGADFQGFLGIGRGPDTDPDW